MSALRRPWRIALAVITALALTGAAAWLLLRSGRSRSLQSMPPSQSNLVIIVSDALRRDILGCYGGPAHTPHIDRLAREGTLFENAYSTAPSTLPSSVGMLTGEYSRAFSLGSEPRSHPRPGLSEERYLVLVPDARKMLAEYLTDRGYSAVASVENAVVKRSNILQGFDLKGNRLVEEAVDAALPGPFFLLKWIMDPHGPYNPPREYLDALGVDWKSLPRDQKFYTHSFTSAFTRLLEKGEFSPAELAVVRALYRAEVEWMDQRVGRILARLEERGVLDDTVIVFTADHGELMGGHKRFGHGKAFWQPLVRVPLIFRGPGIPRGKRVPFRVSHLDLVPTLMALLDVAGRGKMRGRSYSGVFHDAAIPSRELFFDTASNNLGPRWLNTCALLREEFKLVVNPAGRRGALALYRPEVALGESRDLAGSMPGVVTRLYRRVRSLRGENDRRRRENRRLLRVDRDLKAEQRKTRETLRTLGYIK